MSTEVNILSLTWFLIRNNIKYMYCKTLSEFYSKIHTLLRGAAKTPTKAEWVSFWFYTYIHTYSKNVSSETSMADNRHIRFGISRNHTELVKLRQPTNKN